MSESKKTHQEYMAIAKVLGRHLAAELSSSNPVAQAAALAIHFLSDTPRCLLCLDRAASAAGDGPEQAGRK